MEHVLSGYKYGAWDKVLEFMDFRKSVFSSLQSPLLKVEESLLEFTKEANSHDVSLFVSLSCIQYSVLIFSLLIIFCVALKFRLHKKTTSK